MTYRMLENHVALREREPREPERDPDEAYEEERDWQDDIDDEGAAIGVCPDCHGEARYSMADGWYCIVCRDVADSVCVDLAAIVRAQR